MYSQIQILALLWHSFWYTLVCVNDQKQRSTLRCVNVLTCAGSRGLGKMALTGLSRGDRQAFSLECLCFSAIWGEPGKDSVRYYSSDTHTYTYTHTSKRRQTHKGPNHSKVLDYYPQILAIRKGQSLSLPPSLSTILSASLTPQHDKWPAPCPHTHSSPPQRNGQSH